MLKKDEFKVLKVLFDNLTKDWTIRGLSEELGQKYVQTYRTVKSLADSGDVYLEKVGGSKVVRIELSKFNLNYVVAEIERLREHLRSKSFRVVYERVLGCSENVVCLLFGSQVGRISSKSDFDLLFVIPKEFDYPSFERRVKRQLVPYDCDINIVTEEGLLEMWSHSKKLNVGNEILKRHVVLYGAEQFFSLLKKHYGG